MSSSAVVLLSSGLDSTVNLHLAHQELDVKLALTFQYGQKASKKEIACSAAQCKHLGIPHKVLDISWVKEFGTSSLLDESLEIPTGSEVQIDSFDVSMNTMKSVWVPNRNGIFLNIAAGFAETLQADFVVPGFNKEEASTFPDNSSDYMSSLDNAFGFSTRNKVKVKCYTVEMEKPEIAKKAVQLNVDWKSVWPCYLAKEKWCGRCESCKRSLRAMKLAGVDVQKYFEVI